MPVSEILRRYLDEKKVVNREDYLSKLKPLDDVPDSFTLRDVIGNSQLKEFNLTKGQGAGITRILGESSFVVRRGPGGRVIESCHVAVGDVRVLNDDDLSKLAGRKGAIVLRTLLGKKDEES